MTGTFNDSNPDAPSVWLSRLPERPDIDRLTRCLSIAERERMARLGPARQIEFSHSRWLIRQALAHASGLDPERCCPQAGRPVRSSSPPGWALSLSHSHGIAACAVSRGASVGIDIEPESRTAQWQRVVKRWFTPSEQAWLLATDNNASFLRVWTLKEAWLKATGRGIAGHLQTLVVSNEGELTGDRPGWQGCVGETAGVTVAVVSGSDCRTPAPDVREPELLWLEAPCTDRPTAAARVEALDWWTCVRIKEAATDDQPHP